MTTLSYILKLVSDAEPGSGFGTELINQLVQRGMDGRPRIPATHVKGIIRENLIEMADAIENESMRQFVLRVFGQEGPSTPEQRSPVHYTDLVPDGEVTTCFITRTSINEFGTARDSSLRTSEAISAGSQFCGSVHIDQQAVPQVTQLVRLGLLSLFSIGGNRTRGAGACFVIPEGDPQTPGQVLSTLVGAQFPDVLLKSPVSTPPISISSDRPVTLKLTFDADNTVCVPDRPVVGNVITSGFSIPASAVQGVILHRLNAVSPSLADACYASASFRTWPMLPVPDSRTFPIRVSTTHKISKLPDTDQRYTILDSMIEPIDWTKVPQGASLKGTDGVLLCGSDGVELWRNREIPRIISAHGVHNGPDSRRNLFTVESVAASKWVGMVTLPESAISSLQESFRQNPWVQFGKARTVRGGGQLRIEVSDVLSELQRLVSSTSDGGILERIFIVQSPIRVDEDVNNASANDILSRMVSDSGFGEVEEASASLSVLFGWNSHGKGTSSGKSGLLKARVVIEPGSVFRLSRKPADLLSLLVRGVGEGRDQGFGAVLPHPGLASGHPYQSESKPVEIPVTMKGAKLGYEWSRAASGLTASQISALLERVEAGQQIGLQYLERQKTVRGSEQLFARWKPVYEQLKKILSEHPDQTQVGLRVWRDLAAAKEK